MTMRLLPPEEWHKLAHTEIGPAIHALDPKHAEVLVVEDQGEIVGTWTLMRFFHAECVWIAPEHRKRGRVALKLLRGMFDLARAWGLTSFWTASTDLAVTRLIYRLGGRDLPGSHYVIPVGEK